MLPSPFTPHFLSQLESLRLRTRKEFLGSHTGSYSSPRRGTSLEFADYRRYSPGDDLRYLDWGIYARTDRLYVKVFREEVDLFAYVFIDASASMDYPSRALKYLPATHVGLALSYVILANLATKAGVEGKSRLKIQTPLLHMTKAAIIARGIELGIDYGLTWSCYDPDENGRACGRCDSCQLRVKGFREAGAFDPIPYRE